MHEFQGPLVGMTHSSSHFLLAQLARHFSLAKFPAMSSPTQTLNQEEVESHERLPVWFQSLTVAGPQGASTLTTTTTTTTVRYEDNNTDMDATSSQENLTPVPQSQEKQVARPSVQVRAHNSHPQPLKAARRHRDHGLSSIMAGPLPTAVPSRHSTTSSSSTTTTTTSAQSSTSFLREHISTLTKEINTTMTYLQQFHPDTIQYGWFTHLSGLREERRKAAEYLYRPTRISVIHSIGA